MLCENSSDICIQVKKYKTSIDQFTNQYKRIIILEQFRLYSNID